MVIGMSDERRESRSRRLLFALLLVVAVVVTCGVLSAPLAEPDEARYAEIAREIVETREWVVPTLQGEAYRDKPPLVFWASASALEVFGVKDWAARLPILLAALFGVAVTWHLARRLYDRETAMLAAIVLATSPLYYGLGGLLTLDMPLAFWTTLGMAAVWHGYRHESRKAFALASAAAAFGVLTKGPIAALLIGVPGAVFFALRRDGKAARRALAPFGIALFVIIAAPWFLAVEQRVPGYLHEFIFHHHFERFAHPWHHRQPIWFYAPVLLIGLFPWSLLWLCEAASWRRPLHHARLGEKELFLGLYAAFPIVLFSISSSKLIPYVLPGLAPLAILVASATVRLLRADNVGFLRHGGRLLAGTGAVTLLAAVVLLFHEFHWRGPLIRPYLFAAGFALLALGLLAARSATRHLGQRALATVVCACVVVMGVAQIARASLARNFRALGLETRAVLGPEGTLWSYDSYTPALDFYSGKEARVIGPAEKHHLRELGRNGSLDVLIVRARDLEEVAQEAEFRIAASQGDRLLLVEHEGR